MDPKLHGEKIAFPTTARTQSEPHLCVDRRCPRGLGRTDTRARRFRDCARL